MRFLAGHGSRKKVRWVEEYRGHHTPCWIWQLSLGKDGYGNVHIRGRSPKAHRLNYEEKYGPVPDGLQLDHLCRVRCCVNPDHLEPVTGPENVRRGRKRELTPSEISEICAARGKERQVDLAARYGISQQVISQVQRGRYILAQWRPGSLGDVVSRRGG